VAKNKDGSEITDRMRTEYGLTAPTSPFKVVLRTYCNQLK
jgi:hypothetical protein